MKSPAKKLERKGARSLSDAEILAIFFATGREGASAVELGRELLARFGSLKNLSKAGIEELQEIKGIGPVKAIQLAAVFEFGRRLAKEPFQSIPVTSPDDVYQLMGPQMMGLNQESVCALLLDHRKNLIRVADIFLGTKNECFANPSEILKPAITHSASSLILTHNHPTGDPSPSAADIQATRKLSQACQTIGIELDDHVIIGSVGPTCPEGYYSFRESGLL